MWQAAAEVELLRSTSRRSACAPAPCTSRPTGDDLEAIKLPPAAERRVGGGVSLRAAFEIEEETPPPPDKVEEAFRQFDDNDNGRIEKKELRKALKHLGVDATHVTKALKGALDKYDADGTGSLDLLEFRLFVRGLPGDRVEGAFKQFDANRSGTIELRELKKALKSLGVAATSKAVTAALAKYDDDGSKQLDLGEFTALVNDVVATPELLDDEVKAEAEAVVLDAVAGAELPPLSIRYVLEVEKKVADVAAADADAADGAAAEGGDGAAEEAAAQTVVETRGAEPPPDPTHPEATRGGNRRPPTRRRPPRARRAPRPSRRRRRRPSSTSRRSSRRAGARCPRRRRPRRRAARRVGPPPDRRHRGRRRAAAPRRPARRDPARPPRRRRRRRNTESPKMTRLRVYM